jgi:hypothetical protein
LQRCARRCVGVVPLEKSVAGFVFHSLMKTFGFQRS